MASSLFFLLLFSLLLHQPLYSIASVHRVNVLKPHLLPQLRLLEDALPTQFFEVTKPIELPITKPCSHLVLRHDFGFTYGKPPVFASYSPPSNCPSNDFSKIVLEWGATCKGTQFDRIFGVWLGGVELLRSCTAEPTASGIVWSVQKDITRYYSLLMTNQTLAVFLGNVVDTTYTGVYHVNVTIHFYPAEKNLNVHGSNSEISVSGYRSWADLIVPISRNFPLNDGLWFEIKNSMDTQLKEFKIPQNTYRAVLEVYASFHENDEFWYSNLPNEYISANDADTPRNGPFREILVSLDGEVVGAVWPFTVIYTGGFNPLLWRPISGIGSFDLPSYDIEITPFLGKILDGKIHTVGFNVTNALNVWFIDANLHLWLDKHSPKTEGKLLEHISLPLDLSQVSDFKGANGKFLTTASRRVSSIGSVKSSFGNVVTHSIQDFYYSNSIVMQNNGNAQIVNQTIHFNDTVHVKMPFSEGYSSIKSEKVFPLFLYTGVLDQENGGYQLVTDIKLGFDEKKSSKFAFLEMPSSSLKNLQNGIGKLVIKNDSVVGASGGTQQVYNYQDKKLCYFRNISSFNYNIVYDTVRQTCSKRGQFPLDSGLSDLVSSHSKGFSSI